MMCKADISMSKQSPALGTPAGPSVHGADLLVLCCAAQKDHIILGTDNYFKSSQTKWDQHIGERPPRTRGVPGV